MSIIHDCSTDEGREAGLKAAVDAVEAGRLVVLPTDTVYGIAANAFSAEAVQRLLEAKGRDRTMPPPVLIAHSGVLDGLADSVTEEARALAAAFWPGGLTLICHAQASLQWDLGETRGTVALRVPDDPVAQQLLQETGPLAVSSANRTGMTAAVTAELAKGATPLEAAKTAKAFVTAGIRQAVEGNTPFAALWQGGLRQG